MRGAIPPLPNMPSWRCAQLKKSTGTIYLYPLLFMKPKGSLPCSQGPTTSPYYLQNFSRKT
jgi:hypothetical protein